MRREVGMFAVMRDGEIFLIRPSLADARRELRNLKIVERHREWTVSAVRVILPTP